MQTDKIYPRNFYNFDYEYKNAVKYKDYIQRLPYMVPNYGDYLDNIALGLIEHPESQVIETFHKYVF